MATPLVVLESASLAYGHKALLDRVNFQLDPCERVGLIGRNGSGKSSLLAAIAGTISLDDGKLWRASSLRLSLVAQEPLLDAKHTVFEQVAQGLGTVRQLILEYHQVSQAMAREHGDVDLLLNQLQHLQAELEHQDGWSVNSRIEAVLSRLALSSDTLVGELSGGLKKRVALAQALVAEPEVLILDEPTNHLDVPTIEWLEELLQKFPGSVLFVTHDRRFLDNVATRIVELDRGSIANFPGNYSTYESKKAEMLTAEAVHSDKFDKFLAQEEVWIRKGIEARRTRNEGRVRRLEHLRRERALRRDRVGRVHFNVDQGQLSGKLVAEFEHVEKSFDGKVIIDDFSCIVLRGDKIGLIGPNGIGKSSFLKLVLGELAPDGGRMRLGTKLSIAYFDQFREQLDENATVADTIVQGSQFVEVNGQRKHVISYLGDFLFPAERARAKVSALSGGERNRLLLARLFTRPANVLVLDEPTNDLDIETLELLESLLQEYAGALFIVSHDRAFLDNVVTQVVVFEGDGKLTEYAGAYQDWRKSVSPVAVKTKKNEPSEIVADKTKLTRPVKLSFKESRELETIADVIQALEQAQHRITESLANANLYRENPDEVKSLHAEFAKNEKQLVEKIARWEELETKNVASESKLTQKAT